MTFGFAVAKSDVDTAARTGVLRTARGEVNTPVFMPVGSQATVKTLTPDDLHSLGYSLILCNSYHLYLRPGTEVVQRFGGLHRFMAWDGSILTDSGGYQLFSLSPLARVSEEGVRFRSHIDGSEHFLTPEGVMELQQALGADIIMAFDQPPRHQDSVEEARRATERTHRWAERCLRRLSPTGQALFGIAQGGMFPELRRESAKFMVSLGFPGYAIGGLSLGEDKETTYAMAGETVALLPTDKPRYLMGVGSPEDLLEAVSLGVDMFDSVLPTRVARNGALFTGSGRQNMRNSRYKFQEGPVDPACGCYTCRHFSAAYLYHLFHSQELLAYRLATLHNLQFIGDLMANIRKSIGDGRFAGFKREFLSNYQITDQEARVAQKKKWLARQEAKNEGTET